METLDNVEVVKFGPYRFIGKIAYARTGVSTDVFLGVFKSYGKWIFETLDNMKEHATDETYNVGLYSWSRYDDKEQLLGICVGRFMKADTPVPKDMDYYDIPEILVGKAFTTEDEGKACRFLRTEMERQGYKHSSKFSLSAEIFPAWDYTGKLIDGIAPSYFGFYESFELKSPQGK